MGPGPLGRQRGDAAATFRLVPEGGTCRDEGGAAEGDSALPRGCGGDPRVWLKPGACLAGAGKPGAGGDAHRRRGREASAALERARACGCVRVQQVCCGGGGPHRRPQVPA